MRLHFTSGYHLEGDGQMECANQVLEQYLQVYMNYQQDNWVTLLPMAEFAYNNTTNTTTGVPPFFANKGYHPEFTVDLQVETSLAEVQAFMVDLEHIQVELKENIAQAQDRYWKNADKHRTEAPELKIGNQAYVKAKFFRTRQCRQDISPMHKSPIWTGFDPLDVPHSLRVRNPAIRGLFLIRFPEALQNLPLTSHKIKFNRAILTIILPCL